MKTIFLEALVSFGNDSMKKIFAVPHTTGTPIDDMWFYAASLKIADKYLHLGDVCVSEQEIVADHQGPAVAL